MTKLRAALLLLVIIPLAPAGASADYLTVSRPATVKELPERDAVILMRLDRGNHLPLVSEQQTNGYYEVLVPGSNRTGWVYRTLVRRYPGLSPTSADLPSPVVFDDVFGPAEGRSVTVCSFNIQFLGLSTRRDADALAGVVNQCDLVAVQELVAPPYAGSFPDGTPFRPDVEAAAFFDAMKAEGYDYWLSEEDTGTGERNHRNSSATEWWVTFYRPAEVAAASDLPSGFLAGDRTNHPDYERVPYAFPFRSTDGQLDFVLISVHLQPGHSGSHRQRRSHELRTIVNWIEKQSSLEKDYLILGDMNFTDCAEIGAGAPGSLASLNEACLSTNTNINGPRPYDNVLYDAEATTELDGGFGFVVVDLRDAMRTAWDGTQGPYPGDPYDHNRFRAFYSDHNPVVFRLTIPEVDDDP